MSRPDLRVKLGGLVLKNPVLTASGCSGYGAELAGLCDLGKLGGLCTKGLSREPRAGNPPPRIRETTAGMLNSIGLENIGMEAFLSEKVPALRGLETAVITNLFGTTVDEYATLCEMAEDCERIDAVELNVSCPNVEEGGVEFGLDPVMAAKVTAAARRATKKTLLVKLSPNAGDAIVSVARAVADAGADAVSVMNTISGMDIDVARRRPWLARTTGGLSGPAIKPIALRMVHLIHSEVAVPIVGIGGIRSWEDAAAFLLAGASAVQVGSACFSNPRAPEQVLDGLIDWLAGENARSAAEMVGALRTGPEAW